MLRQLIKTAVWCSLIFASCSIENKGIRTIRGHTSDKQGIAHGSGAAHAERYCKECHGTRLMGGSEGQASCYKCHGQVWSKTESEFVFAPSSHTLNLGGYLHYAPLTQASLVCSQCHGTNLVGSGDSGPPACLLCHEQLWSQ